MRVFTLTILFICFGLISFGQSYSPIYSQYLVDGLVINPAYAGSRDAFSNTIMYRQQWVGFEGAPSTQMLSSHAPLLNEKIGVGLMVMREEINVQNKYDIYTNYAYRFDLLGGRIALGLKAGLTIQQANWDQIKTTDDEIDEVFAPGSKETVILPNVGIGAYYYTERFFAGFSIPMMLSYQEKTSKDGYQMYHDLNHYDFVLLTGGLIDLSQNLKLKPSALFRTRITGMMHLDINANLIIADRFWVGGTYRLNNEFAVILEYQINDQLKLGYSYDIATGDIQSYQNGSHEVMLRYEFRYKVRAANPRYF